MMVTHHQEPDRAEPADLEKTLDSKLSSNFIPNADSSSTEKTDHHLLSEEQAIKRAQELPNDTEPIYLTYAFGDKENPRNWPKWKKWHITCFASMLNVLTYASLSCKHQSILHLTRLLQLPLCWRLQLWARRT